MNRPALVLIELREYRSERTGNTYFLGYLGKARVVMLRDDRAECTGKKVARWNVLLEEPEPREDRDTRAAGASGAGGTARRPSASTNTRGGRPGARPVQQGSRAQHERSTGTAADRAAGDLLRERGIDCGSAPPNDDLPF